MSWKSILNIIVFVLAVAMLVTLLVFWNIFIIRDFHTIRELYANVHGDQNLPTHGRWVILIVGIVFFSILIIILSVFFANLMRNAHFKRQQKDFVNMMTHELKLPMSSIRMFAQTLLQREVSETERKQFIEFILADCDRMNLLVLHLLKSQQIERGALPLELHKVQIENWLQQFVAKWPRPLIVNADPCGFVNFDPMLIDLVLVNLIHNAEKYGNGITPKLKLTAESNWVSISVQDGSQLIPKIFFKKVFEKFFRVPSRETRRQSGVGLGLFIVKTIINLHKGRIEIRHAEDGSGNIFTLSLLRSV